VVDEYPSVESIKKWALYEFKCKLEKDRIVEFDYWFRPYRSMEGLERRHFKYRADENSRVDERTNFEALSHMVGKAIRVEGEKKKVAPPIDMNAKGIHIGPVVVEGFIFDRRAKVLKLSGIQPRQVTSYLDDNGGVRVYRDGLRVYDYGEPENDWLGLEKSRLYDPGFRLNKGLVLAAVQIDRSKSSDLHEKTNREGFIDNEAYRIFREAVGYAISRVEDFRNEDKEKLKGFFGEAKTEPVLAEIGELKEVIESKVKDEKIRKECIQHLEKIEKDYRQINEVLMTSAGAGLHLGSAVHEVSKIIKELKLVVKRDNASERVSTLVQHLSDLMDTYTVLIRRSKEKSHDLKTLISDSLFNVQYRLKAHEVEVVREFESYRGKSSIMCSSRLVMGAILNLVDNSIYWLERWNKKDRKIYMALKYRAPRHIELIVADNGAGFCLPPEQMVRPFVSTKPGGMGLGLHITSEVVLAQGGSIEFPKAKDAAIPSSYNKGAIVSLAFKLEE
jgi:signal transduction histidine kinase